MESSGHQRELEKQTGCRFPLKKQKRLPKEEENTAAHMIESRSRPASHLGTNEAAVCHFWETGSLAC